MRAHQNHKQFPQHQSRLIFPSGPLQLIKRPPNIISLIMSSQQWDWDSVHYHQTLIQCIYHLAQLDALSSLQAAISRGFHTDQLRSLAQLYVEHGFLTDDEIDAFFSNIPVLGEHDNEAEATVTPLSSITLDDLECSHCSLLVILNTFPPIINF